MELNYKKLGDNKDTILILHGIFGSLGNWLGFAKKLANDYTIYLLDLRNHGKSPHSKEFTLKSMAKDVVDFIKTHNIKPPILLGHSMGGKVAMFVSQLYPKSIKKLVVIDIAPKAYPIKHDTILQGLNYLKLEDIKSRKEAFDALISFVPNPNVRHFLLKNLKRNKNNHFEWLINLPVITESITQIGKGLPFKQPNQQTTLFIRGDQSDYIEDKDYDLIYSFFPTAKIITIENTGHWIHVEKPKELLDCLTFFLTNS